MSANIKHSTLKKNLQRPSTTPASKSEYFGALDGFRGLLALLVAIYHTPWLSTFNTTVFMNQGVVMLDLFFVFSGFLMFTLYRNRLYTSSQARKFLWRRFARLYPVHLFMTLFFVAYGILRIYMHDAGFSQLDPGETLMFQSNSPDTFFSFLTNLTLTQAMGLNDSLSFNAPSWTISVEFFAYFTFAALMLWMPPKQIKHFIMIGLLIAGIYFGLSLLKPDMNITYDLAFWRCLGGFYTGVIAAEVYRYIKARPITTTSEKTKAHHHAFEVVALLAYILFIIYMPGKLQFLVAPFALLFVIVFAFDKGIISRVMMTAPFIFLAKISYSVYMVHLFISIAADVFAVKILSRIFGEEWHNVGINGDLYLIPYLALVIVTGYFLQRYVETPAAKWLGKVNIVKGKQSKSIIA